MAPDTLPTRRVAEACSPGLPRCADRWKASGWSFVHDGRTYWVKDVRRTNPLFRATIGRLGLWREARMHRRMGGLTFVPRCVGRLDRDALVFEFAGGVMALGQFCKSRALTADFFDKLEAQVRELHRRGILHMDLRHRSNILVDAAGDPFLVDFETAVYLGKGPVSLAFLRPLLAWADHSAIVKFRARYRPDTLSEPQFRRYRRFTTLRRFWPFGRLWPIKGRRRARAQELNPRGG